MTPNPLSGLPVSLLDRANALAGVTESEILHGVIARAQRVERLGYRRFWVAEHHGVPGIAGSTPTLLMTAVAGATEHLRVGSGGVMLPNHAPLAVAEQFALLEAAAPGRIDLGLGRAPGSDPVTSMALRGAAGRDDTDIEKFPQYLDDVAALMSATGVSVAVRGRNMFDQNYILKATPAAASEARLWLLGSSMYSAHLAAAKGLPYVFAHHFAGRGTEEALAVYREEFRPGVVPAPTTFMTVNASVAATRAEAEALMLPNLHMMALLRTGQPLRALDLVEDAQALTMTPQQQAIVEAGRGSAVLGDPVEAAAQVRQIAQDFDVDEVMINPVASARRGVDPATAPAREATLELLAKELF